MIILQASHHPDIVSNIIADYTKCWASHIDIVMPEGGLLGARHDAVLGVPAGVQIRPAGYYPFDRIEQISFDGGNDEDFYNFAKSQIGKPYDTLGVVGLGIGRDWRNPEKWFCSEFSWRCLEIGKFIKEIRAPISFISPRDNVILGESIGLVVRG